MELRVDAAIAQGRHTEVIGELDALTRDHPMRERHPSTTGPADWR
jgi:hypothetical protein